MDKYLYWLDNVLGLGKQTKKHLLDAFGSGEEIYFAKENYLQYVLEAKKLEVLHNSKIKWDVERQYESLINQNIRFVHCSEDDFPQKLRDIPDAPFGLYVKGKMPDEDLPAVAVIGARECSEYGRYVAAELGKCLGENGICVISGMAAGIDGISQTSALEKGGISFGVLGCGVDVCYPKSNQRLYGKLLEKGGVISEYPPGTQPLKQFFPPRNRIVSGLADVLVVIEARNKSGTAITVEMALEQGKDIFAVPGRVTDRLSDGCNNMIREGAHVFISPRDFVQELYQLLPDKMKHLQEKYGLQMNEAERLVKSEKEEETQGDIHEDLKIVLDLYPQHVDVIAERLKNERNKEIAAAKLNSLLIQMCIMGEVKQDGAGWFSKRGS